MEAPRLIETSVKNYLYFSLHKCHQNRVQIYNVILNIVVFLFLALVFGSALYICWKKKPNKVDLERKRLKDQEMVLSKIQTASKRYYEQYHEFAGE
jgi:hypothetical protein